ncbi:MAG: hypothetical protein ACK56K_08280, partial [Akkermansiaceae bacterium]
RTLINLTIYWQHKGDHFTHTPLRSAPLRARPSASASHFRALTNSILDLLSMIYYPSHASKHQSLV